MVASKKKKKLYLLFHSRNFSKKNFQDAIYYTAGRKNQKDSLSWFEKNSKNFFLWFFLLEKKIFFLSKIFSLQIFFCAQKISSPNSGASPPRKRAPFRRSLAPILCDARRPSVRSRRPSAAYVAGRIPARPLRLHRRCRRRANSLWVPARAWPRRAMTCVVAAAHLALTAARAVHSIHGAASRQTRGQLI